jgi:hypothetical protein
MRGRLVVAGVGLAVALSACSAPSAAHVFSPPQTTTSTSTTPVAAPTTTAVPQVVASPPTTSPVAPPQDPTANCRVGIAPYYPDWNPPVDAGALTAIGDACLSRQILLDAMTEVGDAYVMPSALIVMVQAVCGVDPQTSLCTS